MKCKTIYDRHGLPVTIGYKGKIVLSEWQGDTLVNCPTKEDVMHQKERLAFDFWLCVDEDGREQVMTNSYGMPPVRSTAPLCQKNMRLLIAARQPAGQALRNLADAIHERYVYRCRAVGRRAGSIELSASKRHHPAIDRP